MTPEQERMRVQWNAVDDYINGLVIGDDPVLDAVLDASDEAGLPAIGVAPNQGKFLYLLARILGARRILEIGTLAGYSTIWLARALSEDGELITLEHDPRHAEVATGNIARAGLAERVEVRVGKALDSLPRIAHHAPFDLFFIDADKVNNPNYFDWALRLSRSGSVIVVDNVVRGGRVVDPTVNDPNTVGSRELGRMLAEEPRIDATMVQTVGCKGYDGLAIALVTSTSSR